MLDIEKMLGKEIKYRLCTLKRYEITPCPSKLITSAPKTDQEQTNY